METIMSCSVKRSAYVDENIRVVDIVASHPLSHEAPRAGTTQVPLQEVLAHCSMETRRCLLTLINRLASSGTTPISSETPWTRLTLELSIGYLGARHILITWVPIVNAGICINYSIIYRTTIPTLI